MCIYVIGQKYMRIIDIEMFEKLSFGRRRTIRENDMETEFKELCCNDRRYMALAEVRAQWRTLV